MRAQRILVWNIRHGGGRRAAAIVEALLAQAPSVIVLTEFRWDGSGDVIRKQLQAEGYDSPCLPVAPPTRNGVFVCAREPFSVSKPVELTDHEERFVWATFDEFEVCGLYFPQQRAKEPLFNGLLSLSENVCGRPTLLVGDFNTGLHGRDEAGATFYCSDKLQALLDNGWTDVWRSRHQEAREYSWFSTHGNGFRIDHALASASLDAMVRSAFYSHDERIQRVSDHSMMVVDFGGPPNNRLQSSVAGETMGRRG